jgi:hypothetical protein
VRRFVVVLGATLAMCLGLSTVAFADIATTTTTSTTSTTAPTTTTTIRHHRVAALTGLPDPTAITKRRSALTIKMDNTQLAHPQYGLERADVVYEEIVEGGITRLAAIFNSNLPARVGPVRSVRRTDREIVFPIGGLFAFSGGAAYAVDSIRTAPVQLIDQSNAHGAMFRDLSRPPPHNLFAIPSALMKLGGRVHPPHALFTYIPRTSAPRGAPVASFSVNFLAGYATFYQWNGKSKSWVRSIFGRADVTATGVQVSPTNVVVMFVNYLGGVGVEGSEAKLTGSGPVDIFSDGRLQKGRWFRSKIAAPTAFRSSAGKVIPLRPGQTWVELLANGETVSVTPPRK